LHLKAILNNKTIVITLIRTDSSNPDFRKLVAALDKDLAIRDGDEHSFFAQFNKIDLIKHVVVAYADNEPVGCGAIKEYAPGTMEVKRMYVPPTHRGQGIASLVLRDLEGWAKEMNYINCILETGYKQPEAIRLYTKNEYTVIPNYGQYAGVASSVCFEKVL
jgi:putative acetyltransferase